MIAAYIGAGTLVLVAWTSFNAAFIALRAKDRVCAALLAAVSVLSCLGAWWLLS